MSDIIEPAQTGRARCRHCRKEIEEGDWRFGSDHEGFYGDGGASYAWFHLRCASQRMPDRLLPLLKKQGQRNIDGYDKLIAACGVGIKKSASIYPYGERASTGRAKCIKCEQAIAKGEFRVAIEREIVTGSFMTVGAGYLHPKCAVVHLADPDLGEHLRSNSSMLSKSELDVLAKECEAAAKDAPKAAATAALSPAALARKPTNPAKIGADLVFADQLIEKNDLRGELIVVESDLHAMGIDDPKAAPLEARARELRPKATALWVKEMKAKKIGVGGAGGFTLEMGLPSRVDVKLGIKKLGKVPDHPWIIGYRAYDGSEVTLAALMKHPTFSRIRSLIVERVPFTWDGLHGFCSCDEVKNLESLEISTNLAPRSLVMLMGSMRFERLTHLTLGSAFAIDPDLRGFDGMAGLPALRSLHSRFGMSTEILGRVLGSPLGQRLEELGLIAFGLAESVAKRRLPNLRRLSLAKSLLAPNVMEKLAKMSSNFPIVRSLDLSGAQFMGDSARVLADKKVLPSLRRLDVSGTEIGSLTLDVLRARFGEGLIAYDMISPIKKAATAKGRARTKAIAKKKTASTRRR